MGRRTGHQSRNKWIRVLRCTSVPVDCYWHHFLTNITQYSLQFLRSTSRIPASRGCACTRERANACGLIVNDSSAKRMHAQQPGENASCASAGRNFKSDQTVGFSDSPLSPPSLSRFQFFFFDIFATWTRPRAFIVDTVGGSWHGK